MYPSFSLPQGRLLLAVSGGRDSVALLHIVRQCKAAFAVAHCNFHLRPGDCDRDERFVRSLALEAGAECYVAQFDTAAYAAANRLSVEEAARNLRYEFFHDLCRTHGYDYILTAHHFDDSVETFFINLLRGTGIAGLRGIRYLNGIVCRPLLEWTRADIDRYVADNHLSFVEDYTNASMLYRRNQIRHKLMPVLRQLSPNFDHAMAHTMRCLADAEQVFRQHIDELTCRLVRRRDDGCLAIAVADIETLSPQSTLLYELLRPFGVSAAVADDILRSLHSRPGTRFITPTHTLVIDRSELLVSALSDSAVEWQLHCDTLPVAAVSDFRSTTDKAYFDADKLRQPLALRHWRDGDRFRPYGMRGSKLLSDFFTSCKMSLFDKQRQLLLVDAHDRILWVVGRRTDARAAVTSATTSVCIVTVTPVRQ